MGWHVPRLGDSPLQGECGEFDSHLVHKFIGSLVEMVTMSPCHGEGHGFESHTGADMSADA